MEQHSNKLTSFGRWYQAHPGRKQPAWTVLPAACCFGLHMLVYSGTMLLMKDAPAMDLTTAADAALPFLPWTVLFYISWAAFWPLTYLYTARLGKSQWYRLITADLLLCLVGAVFFVCLPTTNTRPEVTGTDLWSQLVRFIYANDEPRNLLPSMHCVVAWMGFLGVRGNHQVPRWQRWGICIWALCIFASTLLIRQHVLADVLSAVLLAECSWYMVRKLRWDSALQCRFEKLNNRLFGPI